MPANKLNNIVAAFTPPQGEAVRTKIEAYLSRVLEHPVGGGKTYINRAFSKSGGVPFNC
jgi:hypothetical protein